MDINGDYPFCLNQLENIENLFKQRLFITVVWFSIADYCHITIHGNHQILDWIDSIMRMLITSHIIGL